MQEEEQVYWGDTMFDDNSLATVNCHFPPSYVQSGLDKAGSRFWAWPTVLFQVRFNSSVILSWKIEFCYVPDHVCTPATLLYEDLP